MHMQRKLCLAFTAIIAARCASKGSAGHACGSEIDIQNDAQNCGACEHGCPAFAHAKPICLQGVCARGPCADGWTTRDPASIDCDTQCPGGQCTGETEVIPDTGVVFHTFSSGGSYGDQEQTGGGFDNVGVMGESTPPAVGGYDSETGGSYVNVSGFNAALH